MDIQLYSQLAAALPVLVYVLAIWWLDRYEREPLWLLFTALGYGATAGIVFGVVGSLFLIQLSGVNDTNIATALFAPLAEEPAKAGFLYFLVLKRSINFDNTTDGLVYGAAAGLGFAMTENYLYFINAYSEGGYQSWQAVVVLRVLFSALMHCAATAIFGAFLGKYRHRRLFLRLLWAPLLGYSLAATVHAAFNGSLVAAQQSQLPVFMLLAFGLIPLLSLLLFTITMVALRREHHMLRRELAQEAATGLFPSAHAEIVPYVFQRWRRRWLPPHINRKRYVHALTTLGFRRYQIGHYTTPPQNLLRDLEKQRKRVRELLSGRSTGRFTG